MDELKIIKYNVSNKHGQVLVGEGAVKKLGEIASSIVKGRTAVVISDKNVGRLHSKKVINILEKSGFLVSYMEIEPGEKTKNLETVLNVYYSFKKADITRTDIVIALGGGVIGDTVGFAAATYLRGVPLIQVPTSLLAQVDSSIGGKTGVDLPFGKNLVGAFYQPCAVITDTSFLKTLPKKVFSDGMAEIIKYACIKDADMFEELEKRQIEELDIINIVEKCIEIKVSIVEQDEKDTGLRMLLNFGHTIGHAVEKYYNYTGCMHGEAVAFGMVCAAKAGEIIGITPSGTSEQIRKIIKKYELPDNFNVPVDGIKEGILSDKKRNSKELNLVVLESIGRGFVKKIELDDFFKVLERMWT